MTVGSDSTVKRVSYNDRKKKSKIAESLQTLMGSLGKKKGDKIKHALAVDSDQAVVAGERPSVISIK